MSELRECLSGVRILDLSTYLPGPLATLLLGDLGAEVLKIEGPTGDPMAELGPRDENGAGIYYEAINAGKTVRRMNLKDAATRHQFLALVQLADIVLETFRPGVMERLGVGYGTLAAVNPRLIYCSLNGYGSQGPHSQEPGHDANYLALAGALHRNGTPPRLFEPPVADCTGSLFAVISLLAALRRRDRTGRGCSIDIALADVVGPAQTFPIADYGKRGHCPSPDDSTYMNGGAAYYRLYATADSRHVVLGAIEQKFWNNFCHAANRPEWGERNRETLPQLDLISDVADLFAGLTLSQCVTRFGHADCCVTPVLTLQEAIDSTHCRNRRLVRRSSSGDLQALFPAWINGSPPDERSPPHTTTAGFEGNVDV